jgi:hypothetical protein
MKKEILGLAAAVLAGAIASPALADVTAVATITKTKDVKVTEHITILKDISITGTVALTTSKAAEALALANIDNHNNRTDRTIDATGVSEGLFSSDAPIYRTATINNSIDNNHGSVGVNQDTGNDVNQANLIAYGLTDQGSNFTNGEASVDQSNTQNVVDFSWTIDTDFPNALYDVNVTASMSNSVNHNTGVVGVNQNSGNNNNQTNAVALAAGLPLAGTPGQGIALAEADLGQENTHNTVHAVNVSATATIDGSISNNTGIVGVNQAVGNNSNEANVAAVGAAIWKP